MAALIEERPTSRVVTFDPPGISTEWICEGEADHNIVTNLVLATTPTVMTHPVGLIYRSRPVIREEGYKLYAITVPYAPFNIVVGSGGALGSYHVSADTTGGTLHITASKETIKNYPTASAPSFKQLIGVHNEEVEGADVVIPVMKLQIAFSHPAGIMTLPRLWQLHDITGTVNSAVFLTRPAGEVLFLGVQTDVGTDIPTSARYQFAISRNLTNQTIGAITGIAKKGWEYAWVRYKDDTETVGDSTYAIKVPLSVHIERVYDTADLAAVLGFG